MDDGTQSGPLLRALTSVRLTTVPLFLLCLLFAFTKPKSSTPTSPSPITAVVISTVSPRRALLVSLFSFIAFTYLLDELIVFVYWAARGFRQSYFTQWRGVELADVTGFLAFFLVILIGNFKDKSGADLWLRKRLKAWLVLAIALDIAYLVLLVLAVRIFESESIDDSLLITPLATIHPLSLLCPLTNHILIINLSRTATISRHPRTSKRPRDLCPQFPSFHRPRCSPFPRIRHSDRLIQTEYDLFNCPPPGA